jgi:hypothetical protein
VPSSALGLRAQRDAELPEPDADDGPSTVGADRPLAERLRSRELRTAVVTGPDGRLLGVVRRADMEARLAGQG